MERKTEPIHQDHYPDRGVLVLTVKADFDNENASRLGAKADDALTAGWVKLVVDISGSNYLSSTGLGHLLKVIDTVTSRNGRIVLIPSAQEKVRVVLQMLGFEDLIPMAKTLDEAFALLE